MKRLLILVPIVLVLLIGIGTANAQRNNDPASPQSGASTALSTGYDLSWYTIAGGAAVSTGGSYSLGGTIGQSDAGSVSGASYTIAGGFWGGVAISYRLYLPLVLKNA
jgi:hypothetical protein